MMPHEWPKTKSYVAGKDLFLFSVFCIVTKKTGNTGAGKLCGRAHPMADGVYLLYRLLEDDSTKSYGEEKTNRNSTDNRSGWLCEEIVNSVGRRELISCFPRTRPRGK